MRSAVGDVTPIYTTLINEGLTRPLDTDHGINDSNQMITDSVADSNQCHLIGDPCGHWVLKKLIAVHREGIIKSQDLIIIYSTSLYLLSPSLSPSLDSTPSFSDLIIQSVPSDCISTWATINRGCFVLSKYLLMCTVSNVCELYVFL